MPVDPRTPVLVGAAQWKQRAEDPLDAREPLELMALVAEAAAKDAGCPGLLARTDAIRVPQGLWRYANPAAWLAERFGATGVETSLGGISGTTVQSMLSSAAHEIQQGQRDVVLLVGAEAEHSKRRAKRAGATPSRTPQEGPPPDRKFGAETDFHGNPDIAAGVRSPAEVFSLFEVGLRHRLGLGVVEHRERMGALWHGLAQVAADNPYAWLQHAPSAAEITTPSPSNRMLAAPYNKLLVANMVVDQAAAVILCSAGTARELGIAEDRLVYPHAASEAVVVRYLSQRDTLDAEPPMQLVGARALELARAEVGELAHLDFYSCFPVAVQLAAEALGIGLDRPLTVTGGLTFAGGPFNSYVLHSIAAMMERLRADPGSKGLVTSVGGFFSKHAAAVYAAHPSEDGFRWQDCSGPVRDLPSRAYAASFSGDAELETYTVAHAGDGSVRATAACRTPAGERSWAQSTDPELLARLEAEDLCSSAIAVDSERRFSLR